MLISKNLFLISLFKFVLKVTPFRYFLQRAAAQLTTKNKQLRTGTKGLVLLCAFSACDRIPGQPQLKDKWRPPSSITDFEVLYQENCQACHGDGSGIAATKPLKDSLYLSIIPRETMRSIIAKGLPGTSMPAFLKTEGGPLTDQQIEILLDGIYAWKGNASFTSSLPSYAAPLGQVAAGQTAFKLYCASCHGLDGKGNGSKGGSVVNPDYLNLVSNQYLRTVIITGRPDLNMPNWQANVPGKPMSEQDIADVVAWLASQRK